MSKSVNWSNYKTFFLDFQMKNCYYLEPSEILDTWEICVFDNWKHTNANKSMILFKTFNACCICKQCPPPFFFFGIFAFKPLKLAWCLGGETSSSNCSKFAITCPLLILHAWSVFYNKLWWWYSWILRYYRERSTYNTIRNVLYC